MGFVSKSLLLVILIGLFASTAFAQDGNSPDFVMTLSTRQKQWDTRTPLIVNVEIKNRGGKSFYLGLKCDFGFGGVLETPGEYPVRYYIKWDKNQDELCHLTRQDLIEIPAKRTVNIKLTSINVEKGGDVPWERHLPGNYRLMVLYGTSKMSSFKDVWLGATRTQYVRIRIK